MWIKINTNQWSASLHTDNLEVSLHDEKSQLITTFRRNENGTWGVEYESMKLNIMVCGICGSTEHVTGRCAISPVPLTGADVFRMIAAFEARHKDDNNNYYHIEIGEVKDRG